MDTLETSKYILAFLLIIAGILHFIKPQFYLKIMPAYLPSHFTLIILSGIAEVICGLLLLFPKTQTVAAYLTIVLLVAVFPANIEMCRKYYVRKKKAFWFSLIRLPFQIVMIWWVFKFVK